MPIGVPKVPCEYRIPGYGDNRTVRGWVNLYTFLFRKRGVFLSEAISYLVANQLIALLLYLSIDDPYYEIWMFINSTGGSVFAGISIFDTMQCLEAEVDTACLGIAASMGSFVVVGGEIPKRVAYPHARVIIHQPESDFFWGKEEEVALEVEEMAKLRATIAKVYVERTGQPYKVVSADMERAVLFSATDAKAYGIIDAIAGTDCFHYGHRTRNQSLW
uniref:clp protease proteolytic subunit n=1 Tax=Anarthria humilis TaxID=198286 RepID=UPI001F140C6B|nr:clp protease proteolytic subunit [Anarthria humilis]ULQ64168.1 clp protease proteolytic subunit [Anarthria humilis]